jgi:hypothetical protein
MFLMPSPFHDQFIVFVVMEIQRQLSLIASRQDPSAEYTRKVRPSGSLKMDFDDPNRSKHEPDASFRHKDASYPGAIIEVSFSQKRKDMPYLADDYLLGSNGDNRVIVGLDIEYGRQDGCLVYLEAAILSQ